jgi:hypothetical protein
MEVLVRVLELVQQLRTADLGIYAHLHLYPVLISEQFGDHRATS